MKSGFDVLGSVVLLALAIMLCGPEGSYADEAHEVGFGGYNPGLSGGDKVDFYKEIKTYDVAEGPDDLYPSNGQTDFDCDDTIYFYFETDDMASYNGNALVTFDYRVRYREAGGSWRTFYSFDGYYTGPWYEVLWTSGWFSLSSSACSMLECTDFEWVIEVETTDKRDGDATVTSTSPIFFLHDTEDPVTLNPTFPSGTNEANLNSGNLVVRLAATDNADVKGLRLRYSINGGSDQYLPSETTYYPVSGTSATQDVSLSIPSPFEGIQVEARSYSIDCEGLTDASSTVTVTIGDSDSQPPVFSACRVQEGPGSDNDGIIEDDDPVRVLATITDAGSGVNPASVKFGGFLYTGQNGSEYYRDFAAGSFGVGAQSVVVSAEDNDNPTPASGSCLAEFNVTEQSFEVTFGGPPESVEIVVDGAAYQTPATFTWPRGSVHSVEASAVSTVSPGVRLAFAQWADGVQSTARDVTVSGVGYYTASYNIQYELVVNVEPSQAGPLPGSGWLNHGESISLTAPSVAGDFEFDNWELDGTPSPGNPIWISMFEPHIATAVYSENVEVIVDSSPQGISVVVDGSACTTPHTFNWLAGSSHSLEAPPHHNELDGARWSLTGWSGGLDNPTIIVVESPMTYTCVFEQEYLLDVATSPVGLATIPGAGWYVAHTSVSLEAPVTASGKAFVGWSIDGVPALPDGANPIDVILDGPHTAVALFGAVVDVSFAPSEVQVEPGDQFSVSVVVNNVSDLYGFDVDVFFDTQYLNVVSVEQGEFLGSDGGGTIWLPPSIDDASGQIQNAGASRLTPGVGVNGTGSIVEILFSTEGLVPFGTVAHIGIVSSGTILSDPSATAMLLGDLGVSQVTFVDPVTSCTVVPEQLQFVISNTGAAVYEETVVLSNTGLSQLAGDISTDFLEVLPQSYDISPGSSQSFTVRYSSTGCGGPLQSDVVSFGTGCASVSVEVQDDWFYLFVSPNDTIHFYADTVGSVDTSEMIMLNLGCGDPCFNIVPQPASFPEFSATEDGYCPVNGENSIILQYSPMNTGNDTIRLSIRDLISTSGGNILTQMPVLIGHGPPQDNVTPCADIQIYHPITGVFDPTHINDTFTVEGVVYVKPGNYSTGSGGYLYDATGGINFWSSPIASGIQEGDLVRLTGPLWSFDGELYLGNFTYTTQASGMTVTPIDYTVTELLADYVHVGSFVKVPGTIVSIGPDSFWLDDGTHQVEVRMSSYAGTSVAELSAGMEGWVQGPCTILNGVMSILPRGASDMSFPPPSWTNIATGALADPGISTSVAWIDFDNDGDDDLYLGTANHAGNILFTNQGGGAFIPCTPPDIGATNNTVDASWADLGSDGTLDLVVADLFTDNMIFLNNGSGGTCWDFGAGDPWAGAFETVGVEWIDLEGDGKLEAYASNRNGFNAMYREPGGIYALPLPLGLEMPGSTQGFGWCDMDGDFDPDLCIQAEGDTVIFARQNDQGFFDLTRLPTPSGGQGVSWVDFDNDGDFDVYLTYWGYDNQLMENDGDGNFQPVPSGVHSDPGFGQAAVWADYDNDGYQDFYLTNWGQPNKLFHNEGGTGTFTEVEEPVLQNAGNSLGAGWSDIDGDGNLDLYVANEGGANVLLRNGEDHGNNYLEVELVGYPGQSNASALSAWVILETLNGTQYRYMTAGSGYASQNSAVLHFGLGSVGMVDKVRVIWPWQVPNGGKHSSFLENVTANQKITMAEPMWDGETPGEDDGGVPMAYHLFEARPNPFNPMTTLAFELPADDTVNLRIYDVKGRIINTLVAGESLGAGRHEYVWQGRDDQGQWVATGIYFYQLETSGFRETKRMTLLK